MEQLPEGFVLDEDDKAESSALPEGFVLDPDDVMEGQGILEKGAKALQYGNAQMITGLGKTAEAVGAESAGKLVQNVGRALAPTDYRSATGDFFDPQPHEKGWGGYGWTSIPRALLEMGPGLGVDLTAGAVAGPGGFVASNAARNYGPTLEARTKNDGREMKDATATDHLAAGASTATIALLNRLGIHPALNTTVKGAGLQALAQVPLAIGKAAVAEGATEAAQQVVDQAGTQIGTKKGWDPLSEQNLHEVGGAAILGGAAGGAIRGVRTPGDAIASVRDMEFDPKSATRVADYVKTVDEKLGSERGEYNALTTAQSHFKQQTATALKGAREYVKETQAEPFIQELQTRLDHGYTLTKGDIQTLENMLGERDDGINLVNALKDRDTVNRLQSRGVVSKSEERFGGGLSGGATGHLVNPRRTIGKYLAAAGGGTAAVGQLAVPFASQVALMSPMLMKMLGTQLGAYGVARGVDSILGTSHPVQRFTDRWNGVAEQDAPLGVTTQDLKAAQRALAKLRGEEEKIFRDAERHGSGRSEPDPSRKSAQIDKGLKAARKAEADARAAQEARRAEEEAAWTQHTAMPKNASEEALWAQHEAQQKKAEEADLKLDAEAQDGIAEGVRKMLQQAVQAGQAQAKLRQGEATKKQRQMDLAQKQKAAQEAAEAQAARAREQEFQLAEKARRAPTADELKAQQEEAMWAAQQAEMDEDWSEEDAARAIEAELKKRDGESKAVVSQSKKAQDALAKLNAKSEGQEMSEAKKGIAAIQKREKLKAAEGKREVSEVDQAMSEAKKGIAAIQTREKLKAAEGKRETSEVNQEMDTARKGIEAIQKREKLKAADEKRELAEVKEGVKGINYREGLKAKDAKRALDKLKAIEEGVKNAKPVDEAPKVHPNKGSTAAKAAEAVKAPSGIEVEGEEFVTRLGVQEARIPKSEVKHSPERWKARVQQRFEVREKFANAIAALGGKSLKPEVDALLARMSNGAETWDDAYYHFEDFVNDLKNDKLANEVWDVFNDHMGALKGTYKK